MTRNDLNPHLPEAPPFGPCIGMLELDCIPRGVETADAVLWEADVDMVFSAPVQPGHYVMLFAGSVRDVTSALRRGAEVAADSLVDQFHIPQIHDQIEAGLRRTGGVINGELDAIGLVQTRTVASVIVAADTALKTATVDLIDLRIANGLDGKSFFTLTGEVSDVRSAITAGARSAQEAGVLMRDVVIARPHPDLVRHL